MIANSATETPPIKKRISISRIRLSESARDHQGRKLQQALLNEFESLPRSPGRQDSKLLSPFLVVSDKKLLNFFQHVAAQIGQFLYFGEIAAVRGYRNQTIISVCVSILSLFGFHDSDQSSGDHAAGKCRLVHDDEDVLGIAVRGSRAW